MRQFVNGCLCGEIALIDSVNRAFQFSIFSLSDRWTLQIGRHLLAVQQEHFLWTAPVGRFSFCCAMLKPTAARTASIAITPFS